MWTATSPTRIIKEQTAWWFQHLSTITLHPRKRDDTPNKFTFWCFLRLKSAGSCCWNPKNQFVSKSFGILWLKLSSEGQQDSGAYSWSWAYEPNNIGNTWEYEVTGDSEKNQPLCFRSQLLGRNLQSILGLKLAVPVMDSHGHSCHSRGQTYRNWLLPWCNGKPSPILPIKKGGFSTIKPNMGGLWQCFTNI